ncbi:MAG TPA: hypothetical protein PLI48_06755 [Gammaproteobacteria bacterium]|nr:hypothetical protein [Gammaproteobacteria bacterium]
MLKPALIAFSAVALAGCGTVIDFGPEPGTPGDEGHWHYQPELHGPGAAPRPDGEAPAAAQQAPAPAPATQPAAPAAASSPAAPQQPVLPPPPPATTSAPGPTSEAMFNDAIRRAVESGDIDRALRLLEEAERLGSRSARPTFIEAVGGRNGQ